MRIQTDLKRAQNNALAFMNAKRLMSHDRWTRHKVREFQREQLRLLVHFAIEKSPFYREFYADIDLNKPIVLEHLPVLDKAMMMNNFDRFVTDRRLKLRELENHLAKLSDNALFLDEYRVLTTGGSSGLTGIFVFNQKEWTTVLANNYRLSQYMDIRPRLFNWIRLTSIGAPNLRHGSARMMDSMRSFLIILQRLSASEPIGNLVRSLNSFQPEVIFTYPSIGAELAQEQIEGELKIQPRYVLTSGEICTDDMRSKMQTAWGISPFESYACTELMAFSIMCSEKKGIHIFEDMAILEVVDEQNRPVPDGEMGHKVLATNLFQRTQPVIRYEISDMIRISKAACPCGRSFRTIDYIEGRNDDILELDGINSDKVKVHPICFYSTFGEIAGLRQFQVILNFDGLHFNLVTRNTENTEKIIQQIDRVLKSKFSSLDVKPLPFHYHFVSHIEHEQSQIGKIKIVKKAI